MTDKLPKLCRLGSTEGGWMPCGADMGYGITLGQTRKYHIYGRPCHSTVVRAIAVRKLFRASWTTVVL